jgi:ABC-type multidrug transport system ATPase subunit
MVDAEKPSSMQLPSNSVELMLEKANNFSPSFTQFCALREKERGALRTLEWSNVRYSVKPRGRGKTPVELLHGISGSASTGEIVGVLGPKKSGKTKFLNAISGHVFAHRGTHSLQGTVKLGGEVASVEELNHYSGYVLRREAMHPTSTVREAITFAATLRLPAHVSAESRQALIEDLISSLGFADTDKRMCKTLTPGERKRVAIGVELASLPSVLYLDEPTSDMDVFDAWSVIRVLKGLVSGGKASCLVVCTMNESSSMIFAQVNRLILIKEGMCVYQGPVSQVIPAFEAKGIKINPGTNLGEFLLACLRLAPVEALPSAETINTTTTAASLTKAESSRPCPRPPSSRLTSAPARQRSSN